METGRRRETRKGNGYKREQKKDTKRKKQGEMRRDMVALEEMENDKKTTESVKKIRRDWKR